MTAIRISSACRWLGVSAIFIAKADKQFGRRFIHWKEEVETQ